MNEPLTRSVGYFTYNPNKSLYDLHIPEYKEPIGIRFRSIDGSEKVVYFNDPLDKLKALRDHFKEYEEV